jgi:cytosine/creatinine deaminase
MWLRSAALADGRVVDVRLDQATGTIAEVTNSRRGHPRLANPASAPSLLTGIEDEVDLDGYLLLPAPAEPHAHLDKALTAELMPNPKGDLMGAIDAWIKHSADHISVEDITQRAYQATLELIHSGITAVRTHVNVYAGFNTTAVEALLNVNKQLGHLIDIQIVALVGSDISGPEGANNRAAFRDALLMDRSIIAGGCPHIDKRPYEASDVSLAMAAEFGRPIDLHTDETLDPSHLELRYLAQRVKETEFPFGAVASHCVSLGMQSPDVQSAVAEEVAAAGVGVVTLPQTNLFLQGRDHQVATPRGLTALRALLDAGVTVGAGADNVRDPFNSMGRSDPFETAALLVMAGHLLPHEAYHAVSNGARALMGLPMVHVGVGSPAELVALPGASLGDAIARADQQRVVIHRARIVASTNVTRSIALANRSEP